jgi:hypothetical protein
MIGVVLKKKKRKAIQRWSWQMPRVKAGRGRRDLAQHNTLLQIYFYILRGMTSWLCWDMGCLVVEDRGILECDLGEDGDIGVSSGD